jgi:hypothetical protein
MIGADTETKDEKESNISVREICIKMNFESMRTFVHKNLTHMKI